MRALVGFVELDGVWLDDRSCAGWVLRDVSLVAEPGRLLALAADDYRCGGPDAVLDVICGHRAPVRGRVGFDGIDRRDLDEGFVLAHLHDHVDATTGERVVQVAGRTMLVAHPTRETFDRADLVITFGPDGTVAFGEAAPTRSRTS